MKINLNQLPVAQPTTTHEMILGDVTVIAKQRIPYEELFEAMQFTINYGLDTHSFVAPTLTIMKNLALVKFFTNLEFDYSSFGDVAEIYKVYDLLDVSGVIRFVRDIITPDQLSFFDTEVEKLAENIVHYNVSALGLVEALSAKNDDFVKTVETVLKDAENEEALELFKRYAKVLEEN